MMSSSYGFGGTDDYGLSLVPRRDLRHFVDERRFGDYKNMRVVDGE